MSLFAKQYYREPKEILGLTRITKKRILELCKKNKLYQTPKLNDVLYLHYQGFESIECLEDYTELKCLWLECNAISEIQGLDKQTKLKCLFLQSNLIRKIENLEFCKELDTINLSQNHIRKIENCGFEILPVLNTLNLASNYIKDCEGLKELENCRNLSVLDLSNNRIDDILVVKIFGKMPELKVLVLQGNPVVSRIPQYRKTLILECKKLTYLDSRPVFDKDRACAEAWKRGGYQEERKENERWNRKERKKMRDGVNATIKLRNKNRKLEDQISLIPSSDSEEEINKIGNKHENVTIDSLWDEVSDDKISESSEMQGTSDSTSDSNSSSKSSEINKKGTSSQTKDIKTEIKQDFQKSEPVCHTTESTNLTINSTQISVASNLDNSEQYQPAMDSTQRLTQSEHVTEESCRKVKLFIENNLRHNEKDHEPIEQLEDLKCNSQNVNDHKLHQILLKTQENAIEMNKEDKDVATRQNVDIKSETKQDIQESESVHQTTESVNLTTETQTSLDSHLEIQEKYQSTVDAIHNISKSEHATDTYRKIQVITENDLHQNEKDYEPLKELEDTMKMLTETENLKCFSQGENDSNLNKSPLEIKKYETESYKINQQLKEDFEELSVNMDNFVKELDREQEQRKEIIEALFNEEQASPESSSASDTSDNNLYYNMEEKKWNNIIQKWDKESKLPQININEEQSYSELMDKNLDDGAPSSSTKNNYENFSRAHLDISLLNRESSEALNIFEKEADELKKLLQKLETENEELFNDINKEFKIQKEENCQENKEKEIKEVNTKIVSFILDDIIQSLELMSSTPSSYYIPQLIKDDDESNCYKSPRKSTTEIDSTTIPQFKQTFKHFFQEVKNKNHEEFVKTQQMSLKLKKLTEQPGLKYFYNDSLETLNAQLEEHKKKENARVRRMVDRVYAQKDRYNDTLELRDGKLMVRNKDTGELQDLPKPIKHDTSDDDTDYDTAHSGDETVMGKQNEHYRKSFKPKARKSSEYLITKALNENNFPGRKYDEESDDEFFSIEAQYKPNLYNIDKEFFNKLSLDNLNITETDENHIVHCARSYGELKHCLTQSKEKHCLTTEETDLLENMIEKKCRNSENLTETTDNLSKEEKEWFDKNIKKTQGNPVYEKKMFSIKPGIKLYEYRNDIDNENFDGTGDWEYTDTDDMCIQIDGDGIYSYIYSGPEENIKEPAETLFHSLESNSEEEKAEIESNIDIENNASGSRKLSTEPNTVKSNILNDKNSSECQLYNEILECNVKIMDCNEDLVDTITVDAELH